MIEQMPAQPARNGFEALPRARQEWFLVRVRELSRNATQDRLIPALPKAA